MRGSLALLMLPKAPAVTLLLGLLKFAQLRR